MSSLPEPQVESAVQQVCDRTFQDLVAVRSVESLRAVYSAIALHWFCPPEVEKMAFLSAIEAAEPTEFETANPRQGVKLQQHHVQMLQSLHGGEEEEKMQEKYGTIEPEQEQKPKLRHRRKTLSVDADLLKTVATAFGIEIRGKGKTGGLSYETALNQLLSQFIQEQSISQVQLPLPQDKDEGAIAAMKDQAKALAWMTERLERLEQQMEQLQQERDEAMFQITLAEESTQLKLLQKENEQLKQERDEAMGKLQAFRELLMDPSTQEAEQEEAKKPQQGSSLLPRSTQATVQSQSDPLQSTRRLSHEEALHQIRRAIVAIMRFNDQKDIAFNDKWYISFPVVQTLLRANRFSANQKNIAIVFEQMKQELEEHHDKYAIGSRHNRRHPNIEKITQIIHLDEQEE